MHQLQKTVDPRTLSIAAGALLIDQLTKYAAFALVPEKGLVIVSGVLTLVRFENYGAVGSVPVSSFLLLVAGIAALSTLVLFKSANRTGIALVLGAGASNLLDRLRFGAVRDLLEFFHLSVWNLADSMIIVGVFLILIRSGREQ